MPRARKEEQAGERKDFESILRRLEEIVETLEKGEKGLEESLALFEEGVTLSREGHAVLDRAESSVQSLLESGETADGVERS